jgi:hypothetical protein
MGRVALAYGANRSPRPALSQRGSIRVPGPGETRCRNPPACGLFPV